MFHSYETKSTTSTILLFFNRILSKKYYSFNFNWSIIRWAIKQCETFEFANIEIFRSFSISISKRNHVFDIRLFLFKQINFIKLFLVDIINIYEKSSRVAKIQNLNVFSSKRFAKNDIINANKICSFSIIESIFLISNDSL